MTTKLILVIAVCCAEALAQGSSAGMGTLKLPFLARSASLGEATVADPASTSFQSNPALLADASSLTFSLSHQEWIQSVRSELLTSVAPTTFGAVAFSVSSTSIPGIQVRETPGPPIGEFTARSAEFSGVAGFHVDGALSAGIAVSYLYEKLFVDDANGYGIDLGLAYKPPLPNFKVGVSLLHAGSMNRLRNERAGLPTSLLAGGSYALPADDFLASVFVAEAFSLQDHTNSFRLGVEASYLRTILVRLGYQSAFESRRFSYGVGIHYDDLFFDYGYVPFALDLGNAHLITIGLSL